MLRLIISTYIMYHVLLKAQCWQQNASRTLKINGVSLALSNNILYWLHTRSPLAQSYQITPRQAAHCTTYTLCNQYTLTHRLPRTLARAANTAENAFLHYSAFTYALTACSVRRGSRRSDLRKTRLQVRSRGESQHGAESVRRGCQSECDGQTLVPLPTWLQRD
jgi:hypothetical protein